MNWRRRYRYTFIGLFWTLTLTAQHSQTLSGRVLGYLANRIGDYDGLQIRTAGGVMWLRFPPHTAAQVLKQAPVGQIVVATAIRQPSPPKPLRNTDIQIVAAPVYRLMSIQNELKETGFRLADLPPPPPAQGKLVDSEGPLTGELHDDAGRLSALLTDQYVIDLKPHQGESVQALLAGVNRLGVVGYERTETGFVNKTGRKLIHPTTLTINGQTFAL